MIILTSYELCQINLPEVLLLGTIISYPMWQNMIASVKLSPVLVSGRILNNMDLSKQQLLINQGYHVHTVLAT